MARKFACGLHTGPLAKLLMHTLLRPNITPPFCANEKSQQKLINGPHAQNAALTPTISQIRPIFHFCDYK